MRLVFGVTNPREFIVPEGECMACRHPTESHQDEYDGCGYRGDCSCRRRFCWLHDALDGEHECDAEGEL